MTAMQIFHEHIIRLSMPGEGITRNMLWSALEDFARRPEAFVEQIASSKLSEEMYDERMNVTTFMRDVHFESGQDFTESVRLEHETQRYVASFAFQNSASDFTVEIVEPETGSLFLRFIYRERPSSTPMPDYVVSLRKQAYEAKDQDVAKGLRALLEKAQA